MARKYDHIRNKAIELREKNKLTLDEIAERLSMPKTTVFYWIKDIEIPRTEKQTEAQRLKAQKNSERYAKLREDAYRQGMEEAPEFFKDELFRDFVVLYMAEGTRRQPNTVAFVNSNPNMVKLANRWMHHFSNNKFGYQLQCHEDHDEEELKRYWGEVVNIDPDSIVTIRKSNSNELSGRQWRSKYGLLSVRVGDTYFRARLQAWMDFLQAQW